MPRANKDKRNDLYFSLMHASILMMVLAGLAGGLVRLVDRFRPRPGDIISFDPTRSASLDTEPRMDVISVGVDPTSSCQLDLRMMRSSGGSVVVEAIRPKPTSTFRVHWAGGPTSDGPSNCGDTAELLLDQQQLVALTLAASR